MTSSLVRKNLSLRATAGPPGKAACLNIPSGFPLFTSASERLIDEVGRHGSMLPGYLRKEQVRRKCGSEGILLRSVPGGSFTRVRGQADGPLPLRETVQRIPVGI